MLLSSLKPLALASVAVATTLAFLVASSPGEFRVAETHLGRISIAEEMRLDPSGQLVHAEIRVRDDAGYVEESFTFDPPSRTVVIERSGRRVAWSVPGDEPWILAPLTGPSGEVVPTPLVAWATYRVTANTEWVRLVLPREQRSYVVPRDQYVVDGTVIVGDHAVVVDDHVGAGTPRE
jgi:hypothetical protein